MKASLDASVKAFMEYMEVSTGNKDTIAVAKTSDS